MSNNSTRKSTQLKVRKTFKNGTIRDYSYSIVGGIPISKYMNQKAKEYRIKKRWDSGKIRVADLSAENIDEMKTLHNVGLSFGKIAELYGISRYIVASAIEKSNTKNAMEKSTSQSPNALTV